MKKDARAKLDDSAQPSGGHRYAFETTDWFEKALKKQFGPKSSPPTQYVLAKLQEFERDWHDDLPLHDLESRWEYEPVSSEARCQQLRVYQIRLGKDVRVWFTVVPPFARAFYLEADQKQGKSTQSATIARCCNRACQIWEDT